MMQFLWDAGTWSIKNVFKPTLGYWWAEILFLILFSATCIVVGLMVYYIIKNNRLGIALKEKVDTICNLNTANETLEKENSSLKEMNSCLEEKLAERDNVDAELIVD